MEEVVAMMEWDEIAEMYAERDRIRKSAGFVEDRHRARTLLPSGAYALGFNPPRRVPRRPQWSDLPSEMVSNIASQLREGGPDYVRLYLSNKVTATDLVSPIDVMVSRLTSIMMGYGFEKWCFSNYGHDAIQRMLKEFMLTMESGHGWLSHAKDESTSAMYISEDGIETGEISLVSDIDITYMQYRTKRRSNRIDRIVEILSKVTGMSVFDGRTRMGDANRIEAAKEANERSAKGAIGLGQGMRRMGYRKGFFHNYNDFRVIDFFVACIAPHARNVGWDVVKDFEAIHFTRGDVKGKVWVYLSISSDLPGVSQAEELNATVSLKEHLGIYLSIFASETGMTLRYIDIQSEQQPDYESLYDYQYEEMFRE